LVHHPPRFSKERLAVVLPAGHEVLECPFVSVVEFRFGEESLVHLSARVSEFLPWALRREFRRHFHSLGSAPQLRYDESFFQGPRGNDVLRGVWYWLERGGSGRTRVDC
jgi:hypothetical protein